MSSYLHVEVSVNFFFFLFFFLLRRTFKKICSLVDFIFCRGVTSLRHKATNIVPIFWLTDISQTKQVTLFLSIVKQGVNNIVF